jgi:hypothetical protein
MVDRQNATDNNNLLNMFVLQNDLRWGGKR